MANKIIYKKPLIFFFVVGMFYSLLLTVLLYSTEPSFAAACPVLDGGVGDGDSTVNGVITISANATWSADGTNLGSFDCSGTEVHVTNNAVLSLASYQDGDSDYTDDYGVTIIADDITVDSGASISANSLGYPDDKGIGYAGTLGSGYGGLGYGTTDTSKAYGSVYEPDDLGSGGADSYGGGAMKFIVSDTLIVNGEITSNGEYTSSSDMETGTGGSIWIDTSVLDGDGIIEANGGDTPGNGDTGSGGRIAVYYTTDNSSIISSVGTASPKIYAHGGVYDNNGSLISYGGAGTVYIEHEGVDTSHQGTLFVANRGDAPSNYDAVLTSGTYTFKEIIMTGGGNLRAGGSGSVLNIADNTIITGDSSIPRLSFEGTLVYSSAEALAVNNYELGVQGILSMSSTDDINIGNISSGKIGLYANAHGITGGEYTFGDFSVGEYGEAYLASYQDGDSDYTEDYGVTIIADNITVDSGASISANSLGYPDDKGIGYAGTLGSGYGGLGHGTTDTSKAYGSVYEPDDLGSGGADSYGGGAMKFIVSDTLIVNGEITSNGEDTSSSDMETGTGGSIWIDTSVLDGDGIIEANGGDSPGDESETGSGGRIAIYYGTDNSSIISSIGEADPKVHANGGVLDNNGPLISYGGAGTVYIEHEGVDTSHQGTLFVANGGDHPSNYDAVLTSGSYTFKEIIMTGGGNLRAGGSGSVLNIADNDNIVKDSSIPRLSFEGTLAYADSADLDINDYALQVEGILSMPSTDDVNIGTTSTGEMILHADAYGVTDGEFTFGDVVVGKYGTMTFYPSQDGDTDYTEDYGVTLNAENLTIDSDGVNIGSINADSLGYPDDKGIGYVDEKHGSSYGGLGYSATDTSKPYGSIYEPDDLGSGGADSYGGGAMKFIVSDTLIVNGEITSNGEDTGGNSLETGTGGSIWIDTSVLDGDGIIEANGGDSPGDESETGSGGRIAIYYGTDNSSIISSIGEADPKVHANGGILDNNDSLISYAGAGTVYIEHEGVDTSNQGTLLVDNVGDHPSNFDAVLTSGTYTFKEIVLTGKGNLRILGSASVLNILPGNSLSGDDSAIFTAEGDISLSGGTTIAGLNINATGDFSPNSSDVTLGSNSNLTIYANTAVRIAKALDPINQYNFGNLIVEDGGNLSLVPYNNGDANYENDYGVDLQVSSLDVKTGGVIESNSYGYAAGAGTGAGTTATGGTYAGYGAQGSGGCSTGLGSKYGSESDPQDLGSGGGGTGGAGGGVVMIESVGDVTVDGTISANGASISTINSGAGSGGSVKLISNGVFGSAGSGGYIQANGGNATGATCSAGGGGGRVSVQYSSKTYDGAIEALYGSGGVGAEGGTVYESTFNANPDEVSNLLPTNLTDGSYTNDNTPTFVFTINDSEGDPLSYHIQIDNSVGFDSAVVDYTLGSLSSGEYSFTVGQAAGDGTYDAGSESQTLSDDSYYWRVESSDAGGSSGYTTANNGEIAFILDTQPPSVPGDPSTTTPTTDNTPTWSWAESTDSDSGLAILPYNVQWCGNNSFPSPDCDGNSASVDTNSYTHGISLSDGIWYFRVKASDNAGNISEYSNYAVVEIDSTGPTKPGTPSTTTPRTDRKPTWEWTQSLDDGVPVAEYTVQWSTSSNFTSPTTDTTNTTSYTHSVDLADDRWYFRVYAFDSLGNQSSYSNTGSVVVDNTAPGVPSTPTTALSPTNDATPFIDWNSVSDNTDGSGLATIPYTIQWCTDNTFPSPDCDSYIDTSSVSSYTFLTDLADGTWYYKVKAVDKVGNESAYSDYGTVIIDTDLPDTPTNVTVDAYTQDTTPTWEWDAVYDDGDAAYISNYEIWWCDASDFLDCDANKTNVVTNSYTPGSPLADGSWYVKVKAIDSVGNESYYSDYARAIIDTVPPTPPTSFTRTTPTHDTTPRWDWSGASDSGGSGINAYIVQWCDNEAYTGCDANISNRSVNNFTLPESSEGTYYIRVKGVDRALLESDYSVSSDITIDISDPDIPGTPIADSPTMDKTPTWEWEAATAVDIDYYRLEWSQSQTFSSGVSAANSDTPTYTHTSNLADGTWYARVRARDIAGNYSEYSNTGSLVLDAEIEGVPDVPVTETPTSDTKPIWIWNEFSGESGITYQYKFEWCDNSNFSGCESNTILVSELTYTHLIDLVEGTWYARLSVVSELGVQSGFSELGEVRIDLSDPELPAIINPASKTYMNNPRPSFSWFSRYSDDVIRYRFTLNSAIEVYPVNSYAASTVNTDKYNIYYSNFNDPDPLNDIISLSTKSSSNWGAGRNNGNLSEGINSLEVIAYDGVGNFSSTEVEFFADFHAPSLQDVKINGSTDSSSKTLDTSISISGRVVDQLSGSGEKAAVGPLKVVMTINKLQGGSTTTILTAVNNFPDIYWSYNENIITDNTLNVSDKYADFSFSPSESFEAGEYQIILKAYDKLGNITETTKTLEIVGDITDLNVDELEEIIINNDNASDLINNLDSSNEGGILQNVVQGVRGVVSEGLKIISENLGGVIGGSVNYLVDLQNNLFGFSRGLRSGLLDLIRYAANELANNAEVIANTLGNFVLTHVPEVAADINRGINENVVRPLFADSYSKVVAIWDLWFDKEATAISDVQVVEKGDNYAVIEWKTNHLATSKVNYGDSLDYGESVEYDRKTKVHQVIITDLEPGQEYYYEVMSNGNNYVYDAWHKFSTTEGGNIIDPDSISIMVADAGSGGINKALQATTLGLILYFLVTIFIFNRIRTKDLRKYVN